MTSMNRNKRSMRIVKGVFMKLFLVTVSLLFGSMFGINLNAESSNSLESVSDLRWQHRIILISSSGKFKSDALAEFSRLKDEIEDRDLVWFYFFSDHIETNYMHDLAKDFVANIKNQYLKTNHSAILIGKDGGVKLRQNALDLKQILALIDTMPMRLDEMKNKRK